MSNPPTIDPDEEWIFSLSDGTNSRPIRRLKSFMNERGWSAVANKPRTPRLARRRKTRALISTGRKRKNGQEDASGSA